MAARAGAALKSARPLAGCVREPRDADDQRHVHSVLPQGAFFPHVVLPQVPAVVRVRHHGGGRGQLEPVERVEDLAGHSVAP